MENNFKTSARIVFEIGKESIENKIIALSEIIKNSYDAGATKCDVIIHEDGELINLFDRKISSIEIVDNGIGMNDNDLSNNWLIIGTNNKKMLKEQNLQNYSVRVPVGEKGIGRFAINKIGNKVTIITKKNNESCYCLNIDFNKFLDDKMLEDIKMPINLYNGDKKIYTSSGTRIIIEDLNEEWNDTDLRKVYTEILKLQSPFKNENDKFDINFISNDENMFDNYFTINEVLEYSLWQASIDVEPGTAQGKMIFSFKPYLEMQGFKSFTEYKTVEYKYADEKLENIDISKYKIGPIKVRLYAFHRTPKVLKMLNMKKDVLTNYLDENGGVRVYRSGQRIYNYGSRDEDWLGLNLKRLNNPSKNLSKNIIIGIIDLDATKSTDLIEKTNREGFIENAAFIEFKKIIETIVDNFALFIVPSKNKVKELIDKNIKREKIDDTVEEFIYEIENIDFVHEDDKKNIIKKFSEIADEFQKSRKLYLSIASSSVEFNMIFHDIDKQVKSLLNMLKTKEISYEDLKNNIININDLLNAQSDLIRNRDFSKISSVKLIEKFKNYAHYRLVDHNITLKVIVDNFDFIGIESQILRILINLFDNSVYWLELQSDKEIFIKMQKEGKKNIIYFADNGPGFNVDDPNILFSPFVSKKKNGLGLGLFIVNEIVSMHNGKIDFDIIDDAIPSLYSGVKYRIELEDRDGIK